MCDDGDQYTNCNTPFNCGGRNISNKLMYPFWGEHREDCGFSDDPNMKLTCEKDVPKITINSVKYRIIDWDNTTRQLKVARDDYWSGICAVSVSANNKFNSTFENTLFQHDGDVPSLNLLYNCNTDQPSMVYSANCGGTTVLYTLSIPGSLKCTPTVVVEFPIMGYQAAGIATVNAINQALQGGFDLKWTGNYEVCRSCVTSGGACGNDGGTGFKCFCKDGPYRNECGLDKAPSSSMSFAFYATNC
ncbi:LEAF RUST 10 DISEASE-RESISTANCE LOCUS RECEPTOR-LIKE PROTEIN KINASE 2.4 [Trifolium repens]|nr:LEAF RUST 10 DISEASE-RESISTANCE LOCUS RECEPTOR-LIKE PROTEIN KINASE 2.4 [Trifolium repens]